MAYRQPAFATDHDVAAVVAFDPSLMFSVATQGITDEDRYAWADRRIGPAGDWISTATTRSGPAIDMTSTSYAPSWGIIPKGHSLRSGSNISLHYDDEPTFSLSTIGGGPAQLPDPTRNQDFQITSPGARYWGLFQSISDIGPLYSLTEFWMGDRYQLSDEAAVQTAYVDEWAQELGSTTYGGREATVILSQPRRRYTLEVINIDPAGPDWAPLDEVLRTGLHTPFWYWPPDDTADPALVKLEQPGSREQEFPNPQAGPRYRIELEMLEQVA